MKLLGYWMIFVGGMFVGYFLTAQPPKDEKPRWVVGVCLDVAVNAADFKTRPCVVRTP